MTVTPSIEYAETIMATIDEMEGQIGFDATLLTLCHVVGGYMHMNCEPKQFEEAVNQVSGILMKCMKDNEKFMYGDAARSSLQ